MIKIKNWRWEEGDQGRGDGREGRGERGEKGEGRREWRVGGLILCILAPLK